MVSARDVSAVSRLAKLRRFASASSVDIKPALENVASALSSSSLSGQIAIIVPGTEGNFWLIDVEKSQVVETRAHESGSKPLDFVVFAKREALIAILQGELSPLEAFFRGTLRYGGNEQLGVAVLRHLAGTADAVFEPCRDESW